MKVTGLNGRPYSVNLLKYRIDWDHKVSAPQKAVKDFLRPYWDRFGVVVTDQDSARRAGERLLQLGAGKVIITLGAQGALLVTAQGHQHYPAPHVQPLDTTAAGDTFIGGFAAGLVRGLEEGEAIIFGQRAAALSVTRAGAQPSIPYLAELTP